MAEAAFDAVRCERLLRAVTSTADPAWRELVELLWPELSLLIRKSRAMVGVARSEDHVREAALLVIEKLGKDGCRASRLAGPWLDARADKTLGDWLRIVSTNVVRDYLRDRQGRARASAGVDKRVLYSLATLLPCDDDLPPAEMLSATSRHAATELAEWAAKQLPPEQTRALAAWLAGSDFDEIAASQSAGDGAEAKRLVRAAVATLRRYALAA